jgi:hypothetical protein
MATRPVTWELDVPPENLLDPIKQTPPPGDPPNIDKLRALLMGTRFELLKISTFAAFLLSFVAIAVHGSHLNNPDNPFVANTNAAFKDLAGAVSTRTVLLGGKTEALALAATHKAEVALGHGASANAPVRIAQADTSIRIKHPAVVAHHQAHAAQAAEVQTAALDAQQVHQVHHARRHHEAVEVASADASNPQWSGSLLDLPNFVTAEGNKAGQVLLNAVEGGTVAKSKSATHKAERAITTHRHAATMRASTKSEWSSYFDGLMAPDSMIAAMAALLLYLIFVVILVQMKGGLRALTDSQATV